MKKIQLEFETKYITLFITSFKNALHEHWTKLGTFWVSAENCEL